MKKIPILKTKLYRHQLANLQFHLLRHKSADWSSCGVGKSLISLGKFKILYETGVVSKLLIVCPLSVMESWAIEIEKHTNFSFCKLEGSLDEKIQLLNQRVDIFLTTFDSIPGRVKTTHGRLLKVLYKKKFDMIIVDEATYIQTFDAQRHKALAALCPTIKYSLCLSGTPINNEPTKVFSLYLIVDDGVTFGTNFFRARNKYFRNIGWRYPKWELDPEKEEEFQKKLYQNAVRVLKDECLDLPPKIWSPRYCYLTEEQAAIYQPIAEGLVNLLQLEEGKLEIKNALTKLAKLSQITSGFVYTDNETSYFQLNPKLQLLLEVIREIDGKVIVYGWWKEDIKLIRNMLEAAKVSVIAMDSQTPRSEIIDRFQNDPSVKVLVTNPITGGFGLTLIAASYIIYYSLSFSLINFQQSQDRIHRLGQTKPCVYFPLFVKGSIDEYIFDSLKRGIDLASGLLDIESVMRLKTNLVWRRDGYARSV